MTQISLSVRIDLPNGARFGPGKAELLKHIAACGSIKSAAAALGMSYPRALKLIEQLNSSFHGPLVAVTHGGADGGGARVTQTGVDIIRLYDEICAAAHAQNELALAHFQTFLVE